MTHGAYKMAFPDEPYEQAVGRREKRLGSVIAKLHRETTKLSQMQDIVGFRVTLDSIVEQNDLIARFPRELRWRVIDRRDRESATGYRAVHLVFQHAAGPVEAQIRTRMQHEWAQLSEFFDEFEPGVKYGLGGRAVQTLKLLSEQIRELEDLQIETGREEGDARRDVGRLQDGMLEIIATIRQEIEERVG